MAAGGIVIDRTEVALAVDQGVAEGEGLGHAYHGVIDGLVGVGMILTEYFADDAGGLAMRLVGAHTEIVHCVEDAALDGFEAVAGVGEGAGDDHAHRVVEV